MSSIQGFKTSAEFVRILENEIRKWGVMDKLVTDCATSKVSNQVKDILQTLFIDGSGKNLPCKFNEILVCFLGYSEDIDHPITFKVYNRGTQMVLYPCLKKVYRSLNVTAPPYDPKDLNGCNDESIRQVMLHGNDHDINCSLIHSTEELIGRHFLMETREGGQYFRAKILDYDYEVIDHPNGPNYMDELLSNLKRQPVHIKSRVQISGHDDWGEYVEWGQMSDFTQEQVEHEDHTWHLCKVIVGHEKNLKSREIPQVLIQSQWESGDMTFESIIEIYRADPYLLAMYAHDNGLLNQLERRSKLLASYEGPPIYMHGENVKHVIAVQLFLENDHEYPSVKFMHRAICYCVDLLPEFSDTDFMDKYDRSRPVCDGAREKYPSNSSAASGKIATDVDANLYHGILANKPGMSNLHDFSWIPIGYQYIWPWLKPIQFLAWQYFQIAVALGGGSQTSRMIGECHIYASLPCGLY